MDKREKAKSILRHYFRLAFRASGLDWDSVSVAEIDAAVDCLIDAAVKETLACIPVSTLE